MCPTRSLFVGIPVPDVLGRYARTAADRRALSSVPIPHGCPRIVLYFRNAEYASC